MASAGGCWLPMEIWLHVFAALGAGATFDAFTNSRIVCRAWRAVCGTAVAEWARSGVSDGRSVELVGSKRSALFVQRHADGTLGNSRTGSANRLQHLREAGYM